MGAAEMSGVPMMRVVGGKKWSFSPLTVRHFGEIEQWARAKIVSIAARVAATESPVVGKLILQTAWEHAAKISYSRMFAGGAESRDLAIREIMDAPDTNIQVLYQSLRALHPKITLEEVEEIVNDPTTSANELVNMVYTLSGQGRKEESNDPKDNSSATQ